MKNIISYLRIREWLDSKVTFMMGILLLFCFCINVEFEEAIVKTAAYFLYISMFLAISYVVNDFSDIEIDKKAGKKKVIANMPKWLVWLSLIVMAVVGNLGLIIYSKNLMLCVVLIILTYFLGLAYSSMGIRFKERGIWGLVECSFAQRCMPLLIIPALFDFDSLLMLLLSGWILLSFIDGLRYIIIHQVNDLENDVAIGVNTYVSRKRGNYRKIIIGLLISEIILTFILIIPLLMRKTIIAVTFILLNLGLEYCIYVVIQKYAKKDIFLTYDSVPMEAFYNILFPLLMGICMMNIDIRWAIALLIIIVICIKSFVVKCKIAAVYINSRLGKRR